jgi:hypothetical protein
MGWPFPAGEHKVQRPTLSFGKVIPSDPRILDDAGAKQCGAFQVPQAVFSLERVIRWIHQGMSTGTFVIAPRPGLSFNKRTSQYWY